MRSAGPAMAHWPVSEGGGGTDNTYREIVGEESFCVM
jgi:hypothetical protein